MMGSVRGLGFTWDGAYIVGGSDEGNELQIVRLSLRPKVEEHQLIIVRFCRPMLRLESMSTQSLLRHQRLVWRGIQIGIG